MLAKVSVALFLFLSSGTVLGGWVDLTEYTGTTEELKEVFFVNGNLGWAVGYNGTIIKTEDGGFNWVDQSLDVSDCVTSVDFISTTTGWVATSGGEIYQTVDGTEWVCVFSSSSIPYDITFTDISIYSEYDGWACGGFWSGGIYLGGIVRLAPSRPLWQYNSCISKRLTEIYTYGGNTNVFICSEYGLARRQPNPDPPYGYHWPQIIEFTQSIGELDFCMDNTNYGWVATLSGCFYTLNGGSSWTTIPGSGGGGNMVTCFDPPKVPPLAWSSDGSSVYMTKCSGSLSNPWRDWVEILNITGGLFRGICSVQEMNSLVNVYAVGSSGIIWKLTLGEHDLMMTDVSSSVIQADVQVRDVNSAAITIDIESSNQVTAEALIYDMTGRLKYRTDLGSIPEGNSSYSINFAQSSGSLLPNGVYYCVVDMGCSRISSSFVLMN